MSQGHASWPRRAFSNMSKIWTSSTKDKRPLFLELRSAKWFIIATVSIAVFSDLFLYAVIVPVIPFALTGRVGISEDDVQYWTAILLAVYAAFMTAFSPIGGWIADKTATRRLPLLVSLIVLAGATLLFMFGTNIGMLVAGRALQGVSASVVWSVGLALLVDAVGHEEIGEAMGYVSLSMAMAFFVGPLLGGVVYSKAGYYAVFYMALGVIVLDIILRVCLVERSVARRWLEEEQASESVTPSRTNNHSIRGQPTTSEAPGPAAPVAHLGRSGPIAPSSPSKASLTVPREGEDGEGLRQQQQMPAPTSTEPIAAEITTLQDAPAPKSSPQVESAAVDQAEPSQNKRSPRSLPAVFRLLATPRLLAALLGVLVVATINTAFDTTIPLRVAAIFHWDSTGAGLIFLAIVIPSLFNPLVGKLCDQIGARLMTSVGFLLICPLMVCLRFVDHDSLNQKVLLCALLALLGASVMLAMIPLLAEITYAVEARQRLDPGQFGKRGAFAQGYGLMNAGYALGTLVGPIWSGLVNDEAGWGTMTWSIGLFSGVTAVAMFCFIGGWIGAADWRQELTPFRRKEKKREDEEVGGQSGPAKGDPSTPAVQT